ncbi:hypothetical protein [Aquibacillus kalidii]|uniref:hypothetical protein n=1 Tax=Aquibacillus kalidii TaxID=2762597 RepID=UPI0016496A02|nr:hypothetical protein [Aquibacillus kalidii]
MYRLFKIIFSIFLILVLLSPNFLSASELIQFGAGDWDTVYSDSLTATTETKHTGIFYSGGGNIRICVSGVNSGSVLSLTLYETDAGYPTNNDTQIGYINQITNRSSKICLPADNVYTDGSNGKAEVYLSYSTDRLSDDFHVQIQD